MTDGAWSGGRPNGRRGVDGDDIRSGAAFDIAGLKSMVIGGMTALVRTLQALEKECDGVEAETIAGIRAKAEEASKKVHNPALSAKTREIRERKGRESSVVAPRADFAGAQAIILAVWGEVNALAKKLGVPDDATAEAQGKDSREKLVIAARDQATQVDGALGAYRQLTRGGPAHGA